MSSNAFAIGGGVRRFVCKRCGKNAHDKQGGFKRWDSKHKVELIYENIDLCNSCFKLSRKEQKQLGMVQMLMQKGILKGEEDLKRFQEDKEFRLGLIKENFVMKSGDLKVRNRKKSPSYYRRMAKRKAERELKKENEVKENVNE